MSSWWVSVGFSSLVVAASCADPAGLAPSRSVSAVALGVTPLSRGPDGVPRLLVASPAAPPVVASARDHIARLAPAWGVDARAMPALIPLGDVTVPGGTITRLDQQIDGLPVDAGELRVMTRPGGELVAVNGVLVDTSTMRTPRVFLDDEAAAIARATRYTHGGAAGVTVDSALAKQVWYARGSQLVAAWIVDAYSRLPGQSLVARRVVMAGADGRVLAEQDLRADEAYRYRVYTNGAADSRPSDGPTEDYSPHPTGRPDRLFPRFITPNLIEVEGMNHPGGGSTPDPWLAPGATATTGNHADVYADVEGNNTPDFRATTTAAGTFDYTYDTTADPLLSQPQQQAAITQLFYTVNYLHDFWYDAGFTEATGNAQADNYGRGGRSGDRMKVIAQEGASAGSRDNAFMFTPMDGMSPQMSVYVWSPGDPRTFVTLLPSNRQPEHLAAKYGPTTFDLTGELVVGIDGTGVDPGDGCEPFTNAVTGKIVLVKRAGCAESVAALNAMAAGAVGLVASSDTAGGPKRPVRDGTAPITIPVVGIRMDDGDQLRTELAAGPVSTRLEQLAAVRYDAGLDATIIAHEYGHYIHHRLQACTTVDYCGAMSEGWGDFMAMMLVARDGDDLDGTYSMGAYAFQQYENSAYFGLRRAPYSTNRAKNDFRFHHMTEDALLPTTAPLHDAFGVGNSEVHNAGEVWAIGLWEAYVALQKRHPGAFEATRITMAKYVVGGLLMAPANSTPTDVRDAILTVAFAADPGDRDVMATAFAGRGFGTCADPGITGSIELVGIVDGDTASGRATGGEATVTPTTSCDEDATLDAGEAVTITVPVTNTGVSPLTNITVVATSSAGGPAITSTPVAIPSLAPGASQTVTVEAAIDRTALATGTLQIQITAPDACAHVVTLPLTTPINGDVAMAASATDHFDLDSVWAPTGGGWVQVPGETGRLWATEADLTMSAASLVSPPLTADAAAPVTITFDHRYSFADSNLLGFDGGVIEITTDGGSTWKDITDPAYGIDPYDGLVISFGGTILGNHRAFIGHSDDYPAMQSLTLDFGMKLAGQTFQLRFRMATSPTVASTGWSVDNVAVTGLASPAFPDLVAETASECPEEMTDDGTDGDDGADGDGGGCCGTGGHPTPAALLGAFGLVALQRRRRR